MLLLSHPQNLEPFSNKDRCITCLCRLNQRLWGRFSWCFDTDLACLYLMHRYDIRFQGSAEVSRVEGCGWQLTTFLFEASVEISTASAQSAKGSNLSRWRIYLFHELMTISWIKFRCFCCCAWTIFVSVSHQTRQISELQSLHLHWRFSEVFNFSTAFLIFAPVFTDAFF